MRRLGVKNWSGYAGLLMLALLAGCKTTRTTGTTGDVCLIWTPVTYSATQDSTDTVQEVRDLNARRDSYCRR